MCRRPPRELHCHQRQQASSSSSATCRQRGAAAHSRHRHGGPGHAALPHQVATGGCMHNHLQHHSLEVRLEVPRHGGPQLAVNDLQQAGGRDDVSCMWIHLALARHPVAASSVSQWAGAACCSSRCAWWTLMYDRGCHAGAGIAVMCSLASDTPPGWLCSAGSVQTSQARSAAHKAQPVGPPPRIPPAPAQCSRTPRCPGAGCPAA